MKIHLFTCSCQMQWDGVFMRSGCRKRKICTKMETNGDWCASVALTRLSSEHVGTNWFISVDILKFWKTLQLQWSHILKMKWRLWNNNLINSPETRSTDANKTNKKRKPVTDYVSFFGLNGCAHKMKLYKILPLCLIVSFTVNMRRGNHGNRCI